MHREIVLPRVPGELPKALSWDRGGMETVH